VAKVSVPNDELKLPVASLLAPNAELELPLALVS
jgi:hypothetical protein